MQKLEEILHAEDAARDAAHRAHAEAERIAREAVLEAQEIRHAAERHAVSEARVYRDRVLASAHRDAEGIRAQSAADLEVSLARAKAEVPAAIAALVRELTE